MKEKESNKVWDYQNDDERARADYIIGLEESALEKWFNGDISGYERLWSKRSFTYFDAVETKRMERFEDMASLLKKVEGNLKAESFEVRDPRVQFGQDMAVLTYQLFAKTNLVDVDYNCIEVFQKENDDEWYVIHSTWSIIRPMDMDFSVFKGKEIV
ncbi:nuclear transport factor 2 family protein [Mucilaginibacter sp. ZT4R22]|uniref:Nuclear transport factor 2 family protein n=1 Tax=Mucilaginibacter pankratovii TaxID=2772110 RepID=A0ABR7WW90_9SPHI|nr:nuclear transport factor 2 family protein [Mucilaginibacter pankratovii]MBD1366548.1 nuclear transport factor 2 family protein [Mucilaginibacter pankratovii]